MKYKILFMLVLSINLTACMSSSSSTRQNSNKELSGECKVEPILPPNERLCLKPSDYNECIKKLALTAKHAEQLLRQTNLCVNNSEKILNEDINKSTAR